MEITLPWPPAYLSGQQATSMDELEMRMAFFRKVCAWEAGLQGANTMRREDRLKVTLTFVPPNRKPHSLDDALERMVCGLDGLAGVLKVDPVQWDVTARMGEGIGGFVRVRIEQGTTEPGQT